MSFDRSKKIILFSLIHPAEFFPLLKRLPLGIQTRNFPLTSRAYEVERDHDKSTFDYSYTEAMFQAVLVDNGILSHNHEASPFFLL